ncbi:MAG: serine/threonine protein kinase [Myxococcales bacterium]|nr:serine/threonine protein kinase [Myxococcales bacterium]
MISCQRCQAAYPDEELRYCGRCGSDMRPSVSREGPASAGTADSEDSEDSEDPENSEKRQDPMIGRVIDGRYRVLEALGIGGMGAVYRVQHTAMGKIAALKMLHPALSTEREVVKRFRREAEAVARLGHPNTVQLFDFGEADGALFMVMEYIRGEDLGKILRRDKTMPWLRAAPLLAQVCEALTEAHEAGIVHRDLKPENVLVARGQGPRGGDVAKVCDFGLAKLRQREEMGAVTARGSLIGTPFYMSPEQIRSEEPDQRSDIYSFGAMMYRMLSGEYPFTGTTPVAVITQHLTQALVLPSVRAPLLEWDARVEAIIVRCLAKAKEERFATIDEVRRAIEDARGPDVSPLPRETTSPGANRREPSVGAIPLASREDFDRFERNMKIRKWAGLILLPVVLAVGGVTARYLYRHDTVQRPVEAEVEPNPSPQLANLIANGRAVRGNIGRRSSVEESDRDVFRFHVERGPVLLRLELAPIRNMDLRAALVDASGARLGEADGGGEGEGEVLPNQRLDAGDFYVEVREVWVVGHPATENVTDQYTLKASWRSIGNDEESEPDDTAVTALAAPLGRPIHGYLARANDLDFYQPEGWSGGTLAGTVTGVDGVDVRLVVIPGGTVVGDDPAKAPGAKVFDAGGPGKGEEFSGFAAPEGAAAPFVVVVRKDAEAKPGGRRATLAGTDARYTLTLR